MRSAYNGMWFYHYHVVQPGARMGPLLGRTNVYSADEFDDGFDYSSMRLPRQGKCELCGKECRRDVDHNHSDGMFRGYLCHQCNLAIAKVERLGLERIAGYLGLPWPLRTLE